MRGRGTLFLLGLLVAVSAQAQIATPVITSINPTTVLAGSPPFILNVTGANFVAGAQVRVNGGDRTTQFVDSQHLNVTIPATDISSPRTLTITALNPGTPASEPVTLRVISNVPAITSVTPSTIALGSVNTTITVSGSGFANNAQVRLNNTTDVATTFINDTQVTAVVPGTELTVARTINVTVFNPSPINQTSNAVTLTVSDTVTPRITLLDPSSVVAGAPGFTLTIFGSNFANNAFVRVNGIVQPTTFIDSSRLTTPISANQIDIAQTLNVTVTNPTGNVTAAAATLTVTSGNVPIVESITPSAAQAGSGSFTLAVTGQNFTQTSIVRFRGSDRTTTFVDSRHVNATIPFSEITVEGTYPVSVFNPPPNGGTSNALNLIVFSERSPVITSLSPSNFATETQSPKLTVTGSRFATTTRDDVVLVDGNPRVTEFVNSTTLVATLLESDVAAPGTHTVAVRNRDGLTSAPLTFTVSAQSGPVITTFDPASAATGDAPFILTVNGLNFVEQSIVTIDGTPRATTFVSPTQLRVQITSTDLSSPREMAVSVLNPNGSASTPVGLIVRNVVPTITSLSPNEAIAADNGFTLFITGTGLNENSVVKLNGVTRPATFDAPTGKLLASITAADIATPQTIAVTVTGPGGTSDASNLTVLAPRITSITPSSIPAGSDNVTLTVTGAAFLPTSKIVYLGVPRDTTVNADGSLSTVLSATDLSITGQIGVRVQNSADVLSAPFIINVSSPGAPRIDFLEPATITAGTTSARLTVGGANFLTGAVVRINGVVKPTEFVSGSQLIATLSASDLARPGTFTVSVANPDGTTGGNATLTVSPAVPIGGRRRAAGH